MSLSIKEITEAVSTGTPEEVTQLAEAIMPIAKQQRLMAELDSVANEIQAKSNAALIAIHNAKTQVQSGDLSVVIPTAAEVLKP